MRNVPMIGGGNFIGIPHSIAGVPVAQLICFHGSPLSACPSCLHGVQTHPGALQAMMRQAMAQQQALAGQWIPHVSAGHFSVTASAVGGAGGAKAILLKPDPAQPDTLGWREWMWSDADKCLRSPSQSTLWPEAELVVPHWDDGEAVRGVSGIHAHLVPMHWKILAGYHTEYATGPMRVHGIVERFGKYVLGTEGWRAEWVIIKELMAPSTEVGLKLEQAYPDVIVHYPEGEEECTSVKSSKWGKGSRPTNRPKPSPSPSPSPSPNSSQAFQPSTQTLQNHLLQNNQIVQHLRSQQSASVNSSQPMLTSPSADSRSTPKESETPPKRDFVFNFLESGPIWIGGLVVAAFLMWALA